MMNYVDMVIVKRDTEFVSRKYLCEAPAWSRLESGDLVVMNERAFTVLASKTVHKGGEDYKFLVEIYVGLVGKLDGVVKRFVYDEEESEAENE